VLGLGLWWDDHRVGRYGVALALGGGRHRTLASGPLYRAPPGAYPTLHCDRSVLHR
jgi:hypothetical protein